MTKLSKVAEVSTIRVLRFVMQRRFRDAGGAVLKALPHSAAQRRTRGDIECQSRDKGSNRDAARNPGPVWRGTADSRRRVALDPGALPGFFALEDFALRSIFERLGRGLPARAMERKLRSLPVEELQLKLGKLLSKSGLSDEDIETFLQMDPRQALELLLGVMRGR